MNRLMMLLGLLLITVLAACSFAPSTTVAGALGILAMLVSYILLFGLGTATSTGRKLVFSDGIEEDYPVYTLTKIPSGTFVSLNATGYAVATTNTAGEVFVGVCMREADNSTGSSGDIRVRVRRHGIFSFITSGAAITSIGTDFYATDNQTVQSTAAEIYVGKCSRYTSATSIGIDIGYATCGIPAPEDTDETVSIPVAATTTITIGDLVFSNAAGYAVSGATTADLKLEGVALATANNSSGGAGDINVSVKRKTNPVTHLTTTGAAVTDIGALVWASGAQAVSLTPGNNLVGVVTKYVSATSVYVSLLPALSKPRPSLGRNARVLYFYCSAPATTPGVNATTKLELPYKAMYLRSYMRCETAPGGSDTLVATITDGTTAKTLATISASATEAEDEDLDKSILLADTDLTVNFTMTGASAAKAHLWIEVEPL